MNSYIIDANVIFSAIISGKKIFVKLFENNVLYAPDFILVEIDKYQSIILKKTQLPATQFQEFTKLLFQQITIMPAFYISDKHKKTAKELCSDIDEKDIAYVALSLEMNTPLLTRDKKLYKGLKAKDYNAVFMLDEIIG